MNKMLIITVLVALLALNAESSHVKRQAEAEVAEAEVVEAEVAVAEVPEVEVHEVEVPVAEVHEAEVHEAEVHEAEVHEAEIHEAEIAVAEVPEAEVAEEGTLTKITGTVKSYYNNAVNTASGYLDDIKGLKLEEKAKNLYTETTTVVSTYAGIFNDQVYHTLYPNN